MHYAAPMPGLPGLPESLDSTYCFNNTPSRLDRPSSSRVGISLPPRVQGRGGFGRTLVSQCMDVWACFLMLYLGLCVLCVSFTIPCLFVILYLLPPPFLVCDLFLTSYCLINFPFSVHQNRGLRCALGLHKRDIHTYPHHISCITIQNHVLHLLDRRGSEAQSFFS